MLFWISKTIGSTHRLFGNDGILGRLIYHGRIVLVLKKRQVNSMHSGLTVLLKANCIITLCVCV